MWNKIERWLEYTMPGNIVLALLLLAGFYIMIVVMWGIGG